MESEEAMEALYENIARVCHAANTEYSRMIGEEPLPAWDNLDPDMKRSVITGVELVHAEPALNPKSSHENWMDYKLKEGWTFGPMKDLEKKTHPNLLPYAQLPGTQKIKDHLFIGICRALLLEDNQL